MLLYLLAGGLGYLIGSFPTAYLLVKWKSRIDIRKAGSGNVGTLNSYEVTNSKAVGAVVLVADLLKGVVAILLAHIIFGNDFPLLACAGIGSLLGHNFSAWIGFKGGRGLATAAGVMLVLSWILVPVWMISWFVGFKSSKDVNVGNAIATLSILAATLFTPEAWLMRVIPNGASAGAFRMFALILVVVILLKLIEPVREYFTTARVPEV